MSEYIDRETAANIADHAILEHPYDKDSQRPEEYSDYNQGWSDACNHIRARLEYVPAADVALVKHGNWIYGEDVDIQCSVCGADAMTEGDYRQIRSDYCPNCGARMDGEENDAETSV